MLIFCGFCCAGKTTIGKMCAEKLTLPFYDTDHLIESAYGKKVPELYREVGAKAFRDLETKQILSVEQEKAVVSVGGGSLLHGENRQHLKKLGILIYLKSSLRHLFCRMQKRGFPAYLDNERPFEHLSEIASHRFPIYEKHCHFMIDTDNLTEKQVFEKVWEAIDLLHNSLPCPCTCPINVISEIASHRWLQKSRKINDEIK